MAAAQLGLTALPLSSSLQEAKLNTLIRSQRDILSAEKCSSPFYFPTEKEICSHQKIRKIERKKN
jgi:hypothetical protein